MSSLQIQYDYESVPRYPESDPSMFGFNLQTREVTTQVSPNFVRTLFGWSLKEDGSFGGSPLEKDGNGNLISKSGGMIKQVSIENFYVIFILDRPVSNEEAKNYLLVFKEGLLSWNPRLTVTDIEGLKTIAEDETFLWNIYGRFKTSSSNPLYYLQKFYIKFSSSGQAVSVTDSQVDGTETLINIGYGKFQNVSANGLFPSLINDITHPLPPRSSPEEILAKLRAVVPTFAPQPSFPGMQPAGFAPQPLPFASQRSGGFPSTGPQLQPFQPFTPPGQVGQPNLLRPAAPQLSAFGMNPPQPGLPQFNSQPGLPQFNSQPGLPQFNQQPMNQFNQQSGLPQFNQQPMSQFNQQSGGFNSQSGGFSQYQQQNIGDPIEAKFNEITANNKQNVSKFRDTVLNVGPKYINLLTGKPIEGSKGAIKFIVTKFPQPGDSWHQYDNEGKPQYKLDTNPGEPGFRYAINTAAKSFFSDVKNESALNHPNIQKIFQLLLNYVHTQFPGGNETVYSGPSTQYCQQQYNGNAFSAQGGQPGQFNQPGQMFQQQMQSSYAQPPMSFGPSGSLNPTAFNVNSHPNTINTNSTVGPAAFAASRTGQPMLGLAPLINSSQPISQLAQNMTNMSLNQEKVNLYKLSLDDLDAYADFDFFASNIPTREIEVLDGDTVRLASIFTLHDLSESHRVLKRSDKKVCSLTGQCNEDVGFVAKYKIRAKGIDAAEHDTFEGQLAGVLVIALFAVLEYKGIQLVADLHGGDKYGRVLADVYALVNGERKNVFASLLNITVPDPTDNNISHHLAVAYEGDSKSAEMRLLKHVNGAKVSVDKLKEQDVFELVKIYLPQLLASLGVDDFDIDSLQNLNSFGKLPQPVASNVAAAQPMGQQTSFQQNFPQPMGQQTGFLKPAFPQPIAQQGLSQQTGFLKPALAQQPAFPSTGGFAPQGLPQQTGFLTQAAPQQPGYPSTGGFAPQGMSQPGFPSTGGFLKPALTQQPTFPSTGGFTPQSMSQPTFPSTGGFAPQSMSQPTFPTPNTFSTPNFSSAATANPSFGIPAYGGSNSVYETPYDDSYDNDVNEEENSNDYEEGFNQDDDEENNVNYEDEEGENDLF